MKLIGEIRFGSFEEDSKVTEAVVTRQRISVDWKENGLDGHLDATSDDGVHFKGYYGYPDADREYEFELTLFKAGDEIALLGTFCDHGVGDEGTWVFRLRRKEVAAAKGKRAARPSGPKKSLKAEPPPFSLARTIPSRSPKRRKKSGRTLKRPVNDTGAKQAVVSKVQSTESGEAGSGIERLKKQARDKAQREGYQQYLTKPLPGSDLDHLLALSVEEVNEIDLERLGEQLSLAPIAAVFKVAKQSKSPKLQALANRIFNKRYGPVTSTISFGTLNKNSSASGK